VTAVGSPTGATAPGTERLQSRENLDRAGQQFEAVFTGMMLKAMRQAKLADPLFDSKAIDTFRDMQDAQVAQAMAAHAPLGIGKAMADFLAKGLPPAQPDVNQAAADPPA
jgi:peptidoglycan hydrolase FlgJ